MFRHFKDCDSGASMIEYGLGVALLSVATIGAVSTVGDDVSRLFGMDGSGGSGGGTSSVAGAAGGTGGAGGSASSGLSGVLASASSGVQNTQATGSKPFTLRFGNLAWDDSMLKRGASLVEDENYASGQAFKFNGKNQYVELPRDQKIPNEDFDISAKFTWGGRTGGYQALFSARDEVPGRASTSTKGMIVYMTPDNRLGLWTGNGPLNKNNPYWDSAYSAPNLVKPGETADIRVSYETKSIDPKTGVHTGVGIIMLNGKEVARNEGMNYLPDDKSSSPVRVGAGRNEGSAAYFFNGQVGDLQVN